MMKTRHFTLIELLAAIGIVILLAGMILGGMSYAMKKGDEAKTIATMEAFQTALEAFKTDYGYYPIFNKDSHGETQYNNGEIDFNAPTKYSINPWNYFINRNGYSNKRNRPYIEGYSSSDKLLDAWDNPLRYQYPATSEKNTSKYAIWSLGPDGKEGTEDDICSWKQR